MRILLMLVMLAGVVTGCAEKPIKVISRPAAPSLEFRVEHCLHRGRSSNKVDHVKSVLRLDPEREVIVLQPQESKRGIRLEMPYASIKSARYTSGTRRNMTFFGLGWVTQEREHHWLDLTVDDPSILGNASFDDRNPRVLLLKVKSGEYSQLIDALQEAGIEVSMR